jgi:hypothetical protein
MTGYLAAVLPEFLVALSFSVKTSSINEEAYRFRQEGKTASFKEHFRSDPNVI